MVTPSKVRAVADEPYVPLLPWVVFAIIGVNGYGTAWAAAAAAAVAVLLLIAPRRAAVGVRNVLMRGAVAWFALLAVLALSNVSWIDRFGLALSTSGFAVIAFASLASTPFSEYWTRLGARPRHWNRASFRRANVFTTMLWGAMFAAVAVSNIVAVLVDQPAASMIFNWLVPLGLGVYGAYRTRTCWNEFVDEMMEQTMSREPIWDESPRD